MRSIASKFSQSLIIVIAALAITACGSTPKKAGDGTSTAQSGAAGQNSGLNTRGAATGSDADAKPLQQTRDQMLRGQRVIYFDFDSSDFSPQYDAMLDAHARHLVANPTARIRLEGHTDERGTREYNIGLGERRSLAVRRALLLRGVARSQLLFISYGEERPAELGSGEAAWARNRRVELVDL